MSQIMSEEEDYDKLYGVVPDRPPISQSSIESRYTTLRNLYPNGDGGGLNLGVYLVRSKADGRNYVQKNIDPRTKILLREIYFLRHLRHPNIIKFIDASIIKVPKSASLYTEWANHGSLDTLMRAYQAPNITQPGTHISESFIWHVFKSLASALRYIHHGIPHDAPSPRLKFPNDNDDVIANRLLDKWELILHRDIKPPNILLRTARYEFETFKEPRSFPLCFLRTETQYRVPTFPRVILADFGIATKRGDDDFDEVDSHCGTPQWMPPELPESTARGDVWSLGAVILSLCRLLQQGPLPPPPRDFTADPREWYMSKEARKDMEEDSRIDGAKYSGHLDDIIYNCMRHKKTKRPFAFKLLEDIEAAKHQAAAKGKLREKELPGWVMDALRRKSD